ncbi:energy transducer TonB [Candidatus Desantisbacteria bacterium]|nr:energy transducer TonB [Candidatus Desantisbacteria bacterium]
MGISLFASLLMHGMIFSILSHGSYIQPKKPITIELNYSKEEIQTVKPQLNPTIAPPIVQKKPETDSPLPLVTPLVAQESNTPEVNPIIVPSIVPSPIIAPLAVIEKPIMGEASGKGMTEQTEKEIIADVSELDSPIRVIKSIGVEYPPLAYKGMKGLILLKILIDGDGNPVRIEVIRNDLEQFSSFSENAVKAVRKWQFSKPMINNSPVCVWYILPIRFKG